MTKIAYLDLEFKDKQDGDKRYKQPTELAYAWFSNKKYLNFETFDFDYNQDIQVVLSDLKTVIVKAKEKYNFDTLVFWDYRQDVKILKQAEINLKDFHIKDLQKNIAEITNTPRLSLVVADQLFNLSDELIKETIYLNEKDHVSLRLHSAVGDVSRIAIIHREFYTHKAMYINIVQKYFNEYERENKLLDKKKKKDIVKKSILQNIPLNLEQIKRIKEGILLLLTLEKLTAEERQLEEDLFRKNKNYQLVKRLEENNYDLTGFTSELLRINRFLNINFNMSLKDLYEMNLSKFSVDNDK